MVRVELQSRLNWLRSLGKKKGRGEGEERGRRGEGKEGRGEGEERGGEREQEGERGMKMKKREIEREKLDE